MATVIEFQITAICDDIMTSRSHYLYIFCPNVKSRLPWQGIQWFKMQCSSVSKWQKELWKHNLKNKPISDKYGRIFLCHLHPYINLIKFILPTDIMWSFKNWFWNLHYSESNVNKILIIKWMQLWGTFNLLKNKPDTGLYLNRNSDI